MILSNSIHRLIEIFPTEMRLIRRSKAGHAGAFVELCNPYIKKVYRYIHFMVPTNRIAEALTVQVFFKAWERLDDYHFLSSSFLIWLYSIARDLVEYHIRTHRHSGTPDSVISQAARGGEFREDFQSIRNAMRALPNDQQHVLVLRFIVGMPEKEIAHFMEKTRQNIHSLMLDGLCALTGKLGMRDTITLTSDARRLLDTSLLEIAESGSTLDTSLMQHFKLAPQLEPILRTALLLQLGREVKPIHTFNNYTHDALAQYLHNRPRRALVSPVMVRRTAMALSMLVAALMVTSTAYAQAAVPGEPFYGWKRASENLWLALAPHSVNTDIALAERRLAEWMAVSEDPSLQQNAMKEYQAALSNVKAGANRENQGVITAALEGQQKDLENAGLTSPELDEYLASISVPAVANVPAEIPAVVNTVTPTASAPLALVDTTEVIAANKGNDTFNSGLQNGRVNNPGTGNDGTNNAGGNSDNNGNGNGNGNGKGNAGGNSDGTPGGGNDNNEDNGNNGDNGNGGGNNGK